MLSDKAKAEQGDRKGEIGKKARGSRHKHKAFWGKA